MIDKEFPNLKGGFIHIPYLPAQVTAKPETPSMSLANDVKGLTAALTAIVKMNGKPDIDSIEGSLN